MASDLSSLMDLVAQNQPKFQTHQALLVIGLQNDFIQMDGRLPVNTRSGFLDRIQTLIPKFRELNGNVLWVQTLYEQDRLASDANTGEGDAFVVGGLIDGDESGTEGGDDDLTKDAPPEKAKAAKRGQRALDLLKRVSARRKTIPREVAQATAEQDDELFLLKSDKKMPACVPDTYGAEFADVIARLFQLPADMVIRTTNYSAFQGTNLLMTLRAKLVTEVYICGCITNVSVLATVLDGARHGVKINIVEDCLGYRKLSRHQLALKRMDEFFDAYLVNSEDILKRESPESTARKPTSPNGSRKESKGSDKPLDAVLGGLSLNESDARSLSRPPSIKSPTRVMTGGPRKLSLASVAGSRKTAIVPPTIEPALKSTDEQFADMLVKGAVIPGAADKEPNGAKGETKMVSKKIRMRSKTKKKRKKEDIDEVEPKQNIPTVMDEPNPSTASTAAETKTNTVVATEATRTPPRFVAASPRSSVLAKAESVLNLRDRTRQQSLKSVASQPVLSAQAGSREKEKDRESWSDRMRISLTRASKPSESTSELKKRASVVSTKAPSTTSKVESRPASVVVKSGETLATPARAPPPKERSETLIKEIVQSPAQAITSGTAAVPDALSNKMSKSSKLRSLATFPILGPGDKIAEGDSRIIHDFFPARFENIGNVLNSLQQDMIFDELHNEVRWQKMIHQRGEVPRLVCCQGDFGEDGSMPVYRHPADQTLPLLHFSPKVQVVKRRAEKLVGHPLNHVLVQLYRSGSDYISEHSDKTLDIVKGSSIVNISFGAQRTMRLRKKKASKSTNESAKDAKNDRESNRETQRVVMPHNSMFVLGLESNAKWLHGIMADKRVANERSALETDYDGMRISLTFRNIGTFIDAKEGTIWGQGATAKDKRDAADIVNDDADEAERMIRAFSKENHESDFDRDVHYGEGFDVLHLHKPPEDIPMLFTGTNEVESMQVQIALGEAKLKFSNIDEAAIHDGVGVRLPMYRDNDSQHTEVWGAKNIISYIDRYHPLDRDERSRSVTANAYKAIELAQAISHALPGAQSNLPVKERLGPKDLIYRIALLEDWLDTHGGPYIAGKRFSTADCAVWPVINHIVANLESWDGEKYPLLEGYHRTTWKKKASVKKVKDELEGSDRKFEDKADIGGLEGEMKKLGLENEEGGK